MTSETLRVCAKRVHEQLKFGLYESCYQKALVCELKNHFKEVQSEYNVNLDYKSSKGDIIQLTTLRLDIYLDKKTIIEIKTVFSLNNKHKAQLQRYLDIMNHPVGYLVNFAPNEVEIMEIHARNEGLCDMFKEKITCCNI